MRRRAGWVLVLSAAVLVPLLLWRRLAEFLGVEMSNQPHEEAAPIDTVLEQVENYYRTLHEASKTLDTKASILVGAGSLLLGLVSTFQEPETFPDLWKAFAPYIIIGVVLYAFLVACGIFGIFPMQWLTPVKIEREELRKHYLSLSSEGLKRQLLANYIDRIQDNRNMVMWKGRAVAFGFIILGIEVIYLLWLTFFMIQ